MLTTLAALAAPPPGALRKMSDAYADGVDVAVSTSPYGDKRAAGSMEHFIATVRDPLVAGCGCPYRPQLDEAGAAVHDYDAEGPRHYPNVVATFADRGIVECLDCGKAWAVPFTTGAVGDKATVQTGTPEERLQAFISPEHLAAADNDGDEPEDVNTEE